MSCTEKRHINHRMGSMLHHRFPNGFTDLFMDETDREVSTLTDRAFRSLCVGDDAVYNDDFLHGYSPFSCLKPLAGEPLKKNHLKEGKKSGQTKSEKCDIQPWKEQQQEDFSHMSSFLKVLSAAEERCEEMLIRNGSIPEPNGESWDKSALRSIERELSEFSDYHSSLTDTDYKNHFLHQSGSGSNNKGKKLSKVKNVKASFKLRKLNIRNFFLHSELSPFQTWSDFNRYTFDPEKTVTNIISTDNVPKWYDMPLYKQLTEAHLQETLDKEKEKACPKEAVQIPATEVPDAVPASPSLSVLPKPSVPLSERRCSSDGVDGAAAPWRRKNSRAKSALPVNHPVMQPKEHNSKAMDKGFFLLKKEVKSVEVETCEEICSVASTPFSICELMTPVIPSRQPTETSEILQAILSPSALDLLSRPHSEAKGTVDIPVKRESYKSLASSILFNLKDNRKRVKSRYSPRKFKTIEQHDCGSQSSPSDNMTRAASECSASGVSTPALLKDGLTICSPILEPTSSPSANLSRHNSNTNLSEDYLLSNLLHSKQDVSGLGQDNLSSPFVQSNKNKSPLSQKQNYPSLNLYQKLNPSDKKYFPLPLSPDEICDTKTSEPSPIISPDTLNVNVCTPGTPESGIQPSKGSKGHKILEKTKLLKEAKENDFTVQQIPHDAHPGVQSISTTNVIRAAKEAINAAKSEASHPDKMSRQISDTEFRERRTDLNSSKETLQITKESLMKENNVSPQNDRALVNVNSKANKEPPPVPKRNFSKSDIKFSLEKQQRQNAHKTPDRETIDVVKDLPRKVNERVWKQNEVKHVSSGKSKKKAETDNQITSEILKREIDSESLAEKRKDNTHILNDLQALKELQKARLGDRVLENTNSKLEALYIDEETKAKNDLISRELRNIKKGMLSMRGNTSAKRKIFAAKDKEQSKQEVFTKLDSNVIVNKALINDNYDKAKLALEEIISERERKRNYKAQDAVQRSEADGESEGQTWLQESMNRTEPKGLKGKSLKEQSKDLNEDNQMMEILSSDTSRLGETHKSGAGVAIPGMETANQTNSKPTNESSKGNERQRFKDTNEYIMNGKLEKSIDTPRVPPRSKKGQSRKDDMGTETDAFKADVDIKNENSQSHTQQIVEANKVPERHQVYGGVIASCSQILPDKIKQGLVKNTDLMKTVTELAKNGHTSNLPSEMSHTKKARGEDSNIKAPNICQTERKTPEEHMIKNIKLDEELNKIHNENVNMDAEDLNETSRSLISPLLLVNGVSIPQSPPDRGSRSSKSSYFSVESALHRNNETDSNVYHSLENLPAEVEGADDLEKDLVAPAYYLISSQGHELEGIKQRMDAPQREQDFAGIEDAVVYERVNHEEYDSTASSTSTFSPTLGIPALFQIKDNTFNKNTKKPLPPWSPRSSLNESERLEVSHKTTESPKPPLESENIPNVTSPEIFTPTEISVSQTPASSSNLQNESSKKSQLSDFLSVPQEEDKLSRFTPSSEGVESTADTADVGNESKDIHSESSEVISNGNGSLLKPPAVLPKSEKAVLKAIKLTNRRMRKEEAHKMCNKSSKSSSKEAERPKNDKSEQRHGVSAKTGRNKDRKHRERTDSGRNHNESHHHHDINVKKDLERDDNENLPHGEGKRMHVRHTQNQDSVLTTKQSKDLGSDRQGRSSNRHIGDKPGHRDYSNDSVISNVPVYKAHVTEGPKSDKPYIRSQSIDRYLEGKIERRLSADAQASGRPEARPQCIEKSIVNEHQQRGRSRDKMSGTNVLRRSHSMDVHSTEMPPLCRQSSLTSQLSRQSSMEHTIITQSFPMTQRKLLQDPDSGQYYFVDLPVQVKTKTYFDPNTGNYVQLPVQPADGSVPQASHVEVLTSPMVVYHSFVPVPLSPMTQRAPVQVHHVEAHESEQQHQERVRQTHYKEGRPYLEPVCGQHDSVLGDFIGTEEVDCPS